MVSSIISHLGRDMHHSIPPLNRDLSNPTRRDRRGSHLPTRIKRNLRKKIRIVQNEKFQLKRSFPPGLGLRRETWSYLGGGQLFYLVRYELHCIGSNGIWSGHFYTVKKISRHVTQRREYR
jgi:hypothetical protein